MQSTRALSIAPDARDWLARDWLAISHRPRVLHVFDHACDLIDERREVVSIVTRQIGNGPFSLVVAEPIIFSGQVKAESQITLDSGYLTVGEITITMGTAKLWSPRPDWEKLHVRRPEILNELMLLSISDYKPVLPHSLLINLSSALVNSDIPSALASTSRLAGLGAGLTPAGDDFIMGALLAVWIIHPPKIARVLAQEVTRTAAPLTTSLSAAWLRSAGKGEAGVLWHEFFNSLISGSSAAAQDSMNRILAVGETSGADALAGFFSVIVHRAEAASSKIP